MEWEGLGQLVLVCLLQHMAEETNVPGSKLVEGEEGKKERKKKKERERELLHILPWIRKLAGLSALPDASHTDGSFI